MERIENSSVILNKFRVLRSKTNLNSQLSTPLSPFSTPLNLHYLRLFMLRHLIDLFYILVGKVLNLFFT